MRGVDMSNLDVDIVVNAEVEGNHELAFDDRQRQLDTVSEGCFKSLLRRLTTLSITVFEGRYIIDWQLYVSECVCVR